MNDTDIYLMSRKTWVYFGKQDFFKNSAVKKDVNYLGF